MMHLDDADYQLVFYGELRANFTLKRVQSSLQGRTRSDPKAIRRLLKQGYGIVKKNLDLDQAERYQQQLFHLGLVVSIEEMEAIPVQVEPDDESPPQVILPLEPIEPLQVDKPTWLLSLAYSTLPIAYWLIPVILFVALAKIVGMQYGLNVSHWWWWLLPSAIFCGLLDYWRTPVEKASYDDSEAPQLRLQEWVGEICDFVQVPHPQSIRIDLSDTVQVAAIAGRRSERPWQLCIGASVLAAADARTLAAWVAGEIGAFHYTDNRRASWCLAAIQRWFRWQHQRLNWRIHHVPVLLRMILEMQRQYLYGLARVYAPLRLLLEEAVNSQRWHYSCRLVGPQIATPLQQIQRALAESYATVDQQARELAQHKLYIDNLPAAMALQTQKYLRRMRADKSQCGTIELSVRSHLRHSWCFPATTLVNHYDKLCRRLTLVKYQRQGVANPQAGLRDFRHIFLFDKRRIAAEAALVSFFDGTFTVRPRTLGPLPDHLYQTDPQFIKQTLLREHDTITQAEKALQWAQKRRISCLAVYLIYHRDPTTQAARQRLLQHWNDATEKSMRHLGKWDLMYYARLLHLVKMMAADDRGQALQWLGLLHQLQPLELQRQRLQDNLTLLRYLNCSSEPNSRPQISQQISQLTSRVKLLLQQIYQEAEMISLGRLQSVHCDTAWQMLAAWNGQTIDLSRPLADCDAMELGAGVVEALEFLQRAIYAELCYACEQMEAQLLMEENTSATDAVSVS